MQFRKGHPELSVVDAVDNLSHLAELDISSREAAVKPEGLTEAQLSERMQVLSWHHPEYQAFNQERIRETFRAVLKYLKSLSEGEKGHLREDQARRGIQAIMILVSEAAQKIDSHTQIFKVGKETQSATELKEYKELQHFFLTKVASRFHTTEASQELWRPEWVGTGAVSETTMAALRDLETVREDREYDLFLVRREDGTPYFNRSLLRHMQLVGQVDSLLGDPTMEDPFLRIRMILDRDAYYAAKEILKSAAPHIDEFSKDAMKFKNIGFVAAIAKALMALMLAANSRNLMQNAAQKSSLGYFADFQTYLRGALSSPEYRKWVATASSTSQRFIDAAAALSHVLCGAFFTKVGSRKEMVDLIRALIERGAKDSITEEQTGSPLAVWNNLRDQDGSIREQLKQYPNGPLMKTIQLFGEEREMKGFDPIGQQNPPMQLYTFVGDEIHVSCMRLPCPISQRFLAHADIAPEFEGFLRSLKGRQRCLVINMQDRTSLHEHARSIAIEEVQKQSEFMGSLMTVTVAKNTDFYMQSGHYIEWDDSTEFMKELREQVASKEQCGFYFPPEIDEAELLHFTDKAIQMIHSVFFAKKERLIHKNRLDFIEIFYLMLTLWLAQEFQPDILSFTCKDAVDTGTAAAAGMFSFLRMMNGDLHWSKAEQNFLLWMLYAPALEVRERALNFERFNRMASALGIVAAELDAHHSQAVSACAKLYKLPFFEGLKVKEASL